MHEVTHGVRCHGRERTGPRRGAGDPNEEDEPASPSQGMRFQAGRQGRAPEVGPAPQGGQVLVFGDAKGGPCVEAGKRGHVRDELSMDRGSRTSLTGSGDPLPSDTGVHLIGHH